MVRPLRIEFPGALYHVTPRGDGREDIYRGDSDRQAFLAVFGEVCERYNWWVHAYCLMTNHYHLLVDCAQPSVRPNARRSRPIVVSSRAASASRDLGSS